ncbi:MAG: DUF484 family protein [Burkholderiales bacterium]
MSHNPPLTEDDIAHYLAQHPDFFDRHAPLLAEVRLASPHGTRAVSLQERQAEMLREKIKGLEQRIMEMVRHGNENTIIADKLQRWTRELLLIQHASQLPHKVIDDLRTQFLVPQVAIKVWGVNGIFSEHAFALGASEQVKTLTHSLVQPYCGSPAGAPGVNEAVQWVEDAASAASVALIALRVGMAPEAYGLLVLASPDAQRFASGMGTDFLERIGMLASAALSRLRPQTVPYPSEADADLGSNAS